ncbi:uncharacterized protein VTP21DRAFT_9484 [Calcarisporiella thermophila]|uniref:uncharacterized protein n=1 Tax=Calcarisporiella thermophila TaxID=911321 RepID=UPI0037448F97
MATTDIPEFLRDQHISYFRRCLVMLPTEYERAETTRMTLSYFVLGGLSLLDVLDSVITPEQRNDWIEWIYSQQVHADTSDPESIKACGFRGSPYSGVPFGVHSPSIGPYDCANIAMTYTALNNLLLLGDDLSRIDRKAIVGALRYLQHENGGFTPTYNNRNECDIRFLYCACVISYFLNDWSGIDIDRAVNFVLSCLSYDFGFGQEPGQESHGGPTYLAIASLHLMNRMNDLGPWRREHILQWLMERQVSGFEGRVNKPPDTCYSFWIGGALDILGAWRMIDSEANHAFLMQTQSKRIGGFSKLPEIPYPDVMHSYLGIAGLAIIRTPNIVELDCAVNLPRKTVEWAKKTIPFWRK